MFVQFEPFVAGQDRMEQVETKHIGDEMLCVEVGEL